MYRDLRANLYFLINDFRFSIIVFWSIFIASVVLLFTISLSISLDTNIILIPSMAIFIYCGISGYLTVKDTFPFMIKMGSTRTAFVFSVIVFNAILAFIMSAVSTFMTEMIQFFNRVSDNDNFNIYSTIQLTSLNETWYNSLFLDFFICFILLTTLLLLGAFFYRFGLIGGGSVVALFLILNLIANIRNWIFGLFIEISEYMITFHFLNIFLFLLLTIFFIWLILRKASTIAKPVR